MDVVEILLLFVVSVTVVVFLILDNFEKNNKTRHEAEQGSVVLDFESKTRTGSFVAKSVNPIDDQDQKQSVGEAEKQVISEDFKNEGFEEIVEETEYPVREISERSNFCSGVLGISGNMGKIGDDCGKEELFDDWEGIERTELEKIFGKAVVFVNSMNNADQIDEDLKLQLYGLQKVALEGTCHESQPMALKVSARSKWNAWEKLGNMGREMAMEKCIEILSIAVPDWKGEVAEPIQDAEFKN